MGLIGSMNGTNLPEDDGATLGPWEHAVMLRIASVNVNGLRGSTVGRVEKGKASFWDWLDTAGANVICLQELRCPDDLVPQHIGEGYYYVHDEAEAKGRAGVAIVSTVPFLAARHIDHPAFLGTGRWIEADLAVGNGEVLTVISAYAHTGNEESSEKMAEKFAWFNAAEERIEELRAERRYVVLSGDLNVAHREADIKNWRGNLTHAGFLPEERAIFDRWFVDLEWVDVLRSHHPDQDGPYSWWSYRGQAFDTNAGWRIDYQIATPQLAAKAVSSFVDRHPTYAERWSDHAPVVVDYDL